MEISNWQVQAHTKQMKLPSLSLLSMIWAAAELCLAVKRRSKPVGKSKDRHSLPLIWIVCFASIALGAFVANKFHSLELPWRKQCYAAGYCLFILGVAIRGYSIIYLGRFFTVNVAIVENHRLIDKGPYRFIRHPTYTGALLAGLGICLSSGNAGVALVIFVPILLVVLWRIRIEEGVLLEAFGDQYRNYMLRTRRLIPLVY
jgi:protein-S-isoprenylcysteine O-methyltransferase